MALTAGNFGKESTASLSQHALEAFAQGRLEIKRPGLVNQDLIPDGSWENTVARGSAILSQFVDDYSGVAAIRAAGSHDVPTMGHNVDKISVPIFRAGISNKLDQLTLDQGAILKKRGYDEDPRVFTPQIANVAIKAFNEKMLMFGDTVKTGATSHYAGFLNNPLVPQGTVDPGVSTFTEWDTKDTDEILHDIRVAVMSISVNTNYTITTTRVLLPPEQYHLIASKRAGDRGNSETILDFAKKFGLPQEINGRALDFMPIRYLAGGGAGGTDRMIVYNDDPDRFLVTNPIDFELSDLLKVPYGFEYYYSSEISPLFMAIPKSMSYFDGI